jgi:predicted ferric reductase
MMPDQADRPQDENAPRSWRPRPSGPALAFLYLAICLLPLVLVVVQPDVAPFHPWERAGAAMGLVAMAAMAVQFLTSGRFEGVSGRLGIDRIMEFHKIAAWAVLLALILHPFLYVVPTWMESPTLGQERLTAYLTLPHYRSGVVALGALVLLVPGAFLRDRLPGPYEFWRATHVLLALVAVGGGLHHALTVGRISAVGAVHGLWWGVAAAILLVMAVLYGWRWYRLHARPWRLRSVTRLADRTWELDIQPAPGTPELRYKAGQFVWMTEGARRFPLLDHPFSVAGTPLRKGLSLIIKEAGDFTSRIGSLQPGTPIGIDGPHGSFTLDRNEARAFALVAGGVGIAPIMSLLRDLVARRDPRPVRLAYAVGVPDNFACLPEIEAAKEILDLKVVLVSEEAAEGYAGETGRLDHTRLAALLDGLDPCDVEVLMCGPGPMVTAVSDALFDLGVPPTQVEYERFDYAGGLGSRQDRRRFLQVLGFLGLVAATGALLAVAVM